MLFQNNETLSYRLYLQALWCPASCRERVERVLNKLVYGNVPNLPGGGGGLLRILGGGVHPGSPNPDPTSDQKMSLFTPVFRHGL